MNNMNIDQVLNQMKILSQNNVIPGAQQADAVGKPNFSEMLTNSLDQVNELQSQSKAMNVAFETGSKDVDLPEVMVAAQKASLSFEAMTEVRNKLLTAYQEVMNMQV